MPTKPPTFRPMGAQLARKAWEPSARPRVERIRGRAGMKLRAQIRAEEPLCRMCLALDLVTATAEIDHIVPLTAGGTNDRGNFQGLCGPCHEAKSATERHGAARPAWLPKPAVPTTIVWGPPAGGKSTWVAERAEPGDAVIDLDEIVGELTGRHGHEGATPEALSAATWERNRRIAALQRAASGRAWIILSLPRAVDRTWWQDKLGCQLVSINPGRGVCAYRACERGSPKDHEAAVSRWFAARD